MKRIIYLLLCCVFLCVTASRAQIAYQVSLLNAATGEARANVTVTADVSITDATGKVLYSGSQRATSNNFGVLSLTVGNSETFTNTPPERMPFFISVTIDGVLVGRSQILSVLVADVAKTLQPAISKEDLVGTWKCQDEEDFYSTTYTFFANGTCKYSHECYHATGKYFVEGSTIHCLVVFDEDSSCSGDREHTLLYYDSNELWPSYSNIKGIKKIN